MDRGRPKIRILKKESALTARRIDLKGGANMKEKEIFVLNSGILDEDIDEGFCCFFAFVPLIA